jgi:hypothetical protein
MLEERLSRVRAPSAPINAERTKKPGPSPQLGFSFWCAEQAAVWRLNGPWGKEAAHFKGTTSRCIHRITAGLYRYRDRYTGRYGLSNLTSS